MCEVQATVCPTNFVLLLLLLSFLWLFTQIVDHTHVPCPTIATPSNRCVVQATEKGQSACCSTQVIMFFSLCVCVLLLLRSPSCTKVSFLVDAMFSRICWCLWMVWWGAPFCFPLNFAIKRETIAVLVLFYGGNTPSIHAHTKEFA